MSVAREKRDEVLGSRFMRRPTQVFLYGSLQKGLVDPEDLPFDLDLKASTSIVEVLRRLEIPLDAVQLAMINHKAVPGDSMISPGDRVALFPKECPVFVDWKDYRFRGIP